MDAGFQGRSTRPENLLQYRTLPVLVDPALILGIPDFKGRLEISMAGCFGSVLLQRSVLKPTNLDIIKRLPFSRW